MGTLRTIFVLVAKYSSTSLTQASVLSAFCGTSAIANRPALLTMLAATNCVGLP